MKFKYLKVGLFGLMLASSLQVSASIISYNGYTLNGNVVAKGGIEWLQWSETEGQSIYTALGTYASDGWQLASNSQMNTLFSDFTFKTAASENTYSEIFSSGYIDATDDAPEDNFIKLFGTTALKAGGAYGVGRYANRRSDAIFGRDADGDDEYNYAQVRSDLEYNKLGYAGYTRITGDDFGVNRFSMIEGSSVALTRIVSVDEPSAFVIIALGIMGLATRRFKKQS